MQISPHHLRGNVSTSIWSWVQNKHQLLSTPHLPFLIHFNHLGSVSLLQRTKNIFMFFYYPTTEFSCELTNKFFLQKVFVQVEDSKAYSHQQSLAIK